jgi:heme A synthase
MVLAIILGLMAIVLGILALRRIRREPELRRGKALAIVGIVLGCLVVLTFL